MAGADFLRLSPDNVAAESDWWHQNDADWCRAFGGQIIAHCLRAASSRAPKGFSCHSLHAHFLQAGLMVETQYVVASVRVGKSYAVYEVTAVETNTKRRTLAKAVVSFCRQEGGAQLHMDPFPTWGAREIPLGNAATLPPILGSSSPSAPWPQAVPADDSGHRWYLQPWRGGNGNGGVLNASSVRDVHAAALAFISDYSFLWSAHAAHKDLYDVRFLTSLDHTIYIHSRTFDASNPMLCETDAPFVAAGRAVVRGRIWCVPHRLDVMM